MPPITTGSDVAAGVVDQGFEAHGQRRPSRRHQDAQDGRLLRRERDVRGAVALRAEQAARGADPDASPGMGIDPDDGIRRHVRADGMEAAVAHP